MRRFLRKCVTVGLAASLMVGMLTGCKAKETGGKGSVAEPTVAESTNKDESTNKEESTPTPEPTESADTGEIQFIETPMDLGGRTIKFVTTIISRYTYAENKDETSNETLEIIKAIEQIEKDYNCKIEFEQKKGADLVEALITAKAAGDPYCDILEFGCSDTYLEQIYSANLVMPLDDPSIKDIIKLDENPWLPASTFGQMFGNQYGVHFKTNNTGDLLRAVVLFNKNLVEKYDLGNPYEMVKNKTWTFDKLKELSATITSKSDGSVFPLMYGTEGLYLPMLIYANGGTVTDYTDGKYEFKGLNDKTLEALNFAVDMKKNGYTHPKSEVRKEVEGIFANGEAVFYVTNYASLKKYTQGTVPADFEVGLLPGPIGPNSDGEYNAVSYTEALFHVSNNVEKPEEVAAVLVAFANRTAKRDMINTELMNTLQDQESAEMLELMYNNMKTDYSRSIGTSRAAIGEASKAIMSLEKTPKEAYEELANSVQAMYDELALTK